MTVRTLVKKALIEIGAFAKDDPLPSEDLNDGIESLNNLIEQWNTEGIDIREVDDADDVLTLTSGQTRALIKNLALELCPSYSKAASGELLSAAVDSKSQIERIGQKDQIMGVDESLRGPKIFNINEVE